jgi:predicted RNA methylase
MTADLDFAGDVDILDREPETFFAPVATDLIEGLLAEYQSRRRQILQLHDVVKGELGNAVHYFIEGNAGDERMHRSIYLDRLFELEPALKQLDSAYWSKALALTDVYDYMPQKRRDEWNEQLRYPMGKKAHDRYGQDEGEWAQQPLPEFTGEAVRPTLIGMLNARSQFFAERVDGIFRALSHEHVTNCPEGFSKRMIVGYLRDSYGSINHGRAGFINDLRCVIAKFMGRDEPKHRASSSLMADLNDTCDGQWRVVDGGALRIRLYKKGTAHLEVHPDMAWRLNCVLAQMHPLAIPSEFRQRPPKRTSAFKPLTRPLPFRVIEILADAEPVNERVSEFPERYRRLPNVLRFRYGVDHDAAAMRDAEEILRAIGGVKASKGVHWQFDYDPFAVIREICVTGSIPDKASHQFYPTPARLAAIAAELAAIGPADTVLEPSAGQGDLAAPLPAERTTCVEISALHCAVLRARGLSAVEADFLEWSAAEWAKATRFDRVVMNPPFADGRAQAHLEAAARLLRTGGRLVAILPASMRGKPVLPGFRLEWSAVYSGEFADTSASVVMLIANCIG